MGIGSKINGLTFTHAVEYDSPQLSVGQVVE